MKQHFASIIFLILAIPLFMGMSQDKTNILDLKLNIEIYAVETLESVIFRLQAQTGQPIDYTTRLLMPYKAKAAHYKDTTLREILTDQLANTPVRYYIRRRQVVLYHVDDPNKSVKGWSKN